MHSVTSKQSSTIQRCLVSFAILELTITVIISLLFENFLVGVKDKVQISVGVRIALRRKLEFLKV